jgi:hypothetical protein
MSGTREFVSKQGQEKAAGGRRWSEGCRGSELVSEGVEKGLVGGKGS